MSDIETTASPSPGPELVQYDRPDFIKIDDSFENLEINSVLKSIAKTNELDISWESLQQILQALISKQCKIMEEKATDEAVRKEIDELSMKIIHSIHDHTNCPFTIQRLCELLIEPRKYYTMYIKYLRAVEKVLAVTSYWEDYAPKDEPMEITNTPNGDGLFTQSIDHIELERHNFDIDIEEKGKKLEEKEQAVETKENEKEPSSTEQTVEAEQEEKKPTESVSAAVDSQPDTKHDGNKKDEQVEGQEAGMDLD